jgi:hypothetical protein
MKEEEEIVDHFDTSQGISECSDVETDSTVDVETPVPSGFRDSTTCDRCLELQDLTLRMEKLSSKMNLKRLCQEEEKRRRKEETASPEEEKRRQEDCIKGILGSIRETFKGKKGIQIKREQKGRDFFSRRLLMFLEIIGDIIADIRKADPCKREDLGNGGCFKYFYHSSFFIHNYLLDVECCVDRYYSSGCADLSKYCGTDGHGNHENGLHSISLVGRIMLALSRVDTLGYFVSSYNSCKHTFPESLCSEINRLWLGRDWVNHSIMSHFSTRECLESLSKDLKWAFFEVQGAVNHIWNHLSSEENPLSSETLTSLLDTASNHLDHLWEGRELPGNFRPSFVNVGTNINDIFSAVTKIKDCVNKMKKEELTSSCEDIKEKISNIYKRIQSLQDRTGEYIKSPALSTLV